MVHQVNGRTAALPASRQRTFSRTQQRPHIRRTGQQIRESRLKKDVRVHAGDVNFPPGLSISAANGFVMEEAIAACHCFFSLQTMEDS